VIKQVLILPTKVHDQVLRCFSISDFNEKKMFILSIHEIYTQFLQEETGKVNNVLRAKFKEQKSEAQVFCYWLYIFPT
jgi:hypothetical protein